MNNEEERTIAFASKVRTERDAEFVLKYLFTIYTRDNLWAMASQWVNLLPEPLSTHFDHICKEMPKTDYWLLGDAENPFTEEKDLLTQKAYALLILFQFIDKSWQLFGKDIHYQNKVNLQALPQIKAFGILKDLIASSPLQHLLAILYQCLTLVTGKDYQERFREALKQNDPQTEEAFDALKSQHPPGEYAELMVAFGHFRSILEAIYCLIQAQS